MIESIIFDIDGTLWDTREVVARGFNRRLTAMGHPELQVTAQSLTALFGKTMTQIADAMLPVFPAPRRYEIMLECMQAEQEVMASEPCDCAYPGVVEGLTRLAREHRLFLVSNAQKGYPELLLEKLGIGPLFSGHLCHGDTGLSKAKTMQLLMERHHISSCVYVGDTQGDLEACQEAGVPFIWCDYGFGTPTHWDGRISSFSQLEQVLKKI